MLETNTGPTISKKNLNESKDMPRVGGVGVVLGSVGPVGCPWWWCVCVYVCVFNILIIFFNLYF